MLIAPRGLLKQRTRLPHHGDNGSHSHLGNGAPSTSSVSHPQVADSSGRGLIVYPWPLQNRNGAFQVLLAYSEALRDMGLQLDVCAPSFGRAHPRENGLFYGVFDRVFAPPSRTHATQPMWDNIGPILKAHHDPIPPPEWDVRNVITAGLLSAVSAYDFVGVHYTRSHWLTRLLPPEMRTVLFTIDLDAHVATQEKLIFGFPASGAKPQYSIQDEIARMRGFDLVTCVGPDDMAAIASVDPAIQTVETPFCLALAHERHVVRDDAPGTILWISTDANFQELSFRWFWQHVWPGVIEARPQTRLKIVGSISNVAQRIGLAGEPGVEICGVLESLIEVYRDADVLAAPYIYGGGIKTRVVDGLSRGIPVVTTTCGMLNTRLVPGRDALLADEAPEFAAAILRLLEFPDERRKLSASGLRYIERWHDDESAYAPFQDKMRDLLATVKKAPEEKTPAAEPPQHLIRDLKMLIPWAIQRCRDRHIHSVAIFGAGSHSRLLIPLWRMGEGPEIRCVLDSKKGDLEELCEVPIMELDSFDPATVDAIVLSSEPYEQEMSQTCAKRFPELPVISIWRPLGQKREKPGTSERPESAGPMVGPAAPLEVLRGCKPSVDCPVNLIQN